MGWASRPPSTPAYSGDATYTSKAATAYTQVMAGGNALTGFALTSNLNPAASGKAVTYTATLAGPTARRPAR